MLRIGEFDRYERHFSYDSGFEVGSTLPRFLSEDGTAKILKCVQTELQKDHGQNTKKNLSD